MRQNENPILPLTNFDIIKIVKGECILPGLYPSKKFEIKHFRGVFMKDELPLKTNKVECGIINLQNSSKPGSHWTAYYKTLCNFKYYFDSYGNACPPKELVKYLGKNNLFYNEERIQNYDDPPICGHLCILILKALLGHHPHVTPLIYERIIKDVKNYKENIYLYNKYAISKY